jgi:beta-lactam-binding protein with PASTA domain
MSTLKPDSYVKLKQFLWSLPFFCFLAGYYLTDYLLYVPSIETPGLIGKNINYAIILLSGHNLNLRIIQEKEDNDLPEGTIIHQSPSAGQKVKANQTIFCVTSHQAQTKTAPNLINLPLESITERLKKERIRTKAYLIPCNHKEGICIAQFPSAQEPLHQRSIITYISAGNKKPVLFPNLQGNEIGQVEEFLMLYGIKPLIFHASPIDKQHHCKTCRVIEQKPLPGSIIDMSKPLHVQVQVK